MKRLQGWSQQIETTRYENSFSMPTLENSSLSSKARQSNRFTDNFVIKKVSLETNKLREILRCFFAPLALADVRLENGTRLPVCGRFSCPTLPCLKDTKSRALLSVMAWIKFLTVKLATQKFRCHQTWTPKSLFKLEAFINHLLSNLSHKCYSLNKSWRC